MHPTKIYLPAYLRVQLETMAQHEHIPLSELVRNVLGEGIAARFEAGKLPLMDDVYDINHEALQQSTTEILYPSDEDGNDEDCPF